MSKDCPAEATKQSKHSPCKVSNNETLLFVLIEPYNYSQNDITAEAFSKTELRESRVSVTRKEHTPKEILQTEVVDVLIQKDPRRQLIGVLQANCKNVRDLEPEEPKNKRAFCVMDDGNPKNKGHAHIGFSETARVQPKNLQAANRQNLIQVFGKDYSLNEIYA